MDELDRDDIEEMALKSLDIASNGVPDGMCDPVSIEFCKQMESKGYSHDGLYKGYIFGEPHYVAVIDSSLTSFATVGKVIVDPTIQQFSDETVEQLPEVAIVTEEDEVWDTWYSRFEDVYDRRLDD